MITQHTLREICVRCGLVLHQNTASKKYWFANAKNASKAISEEMTAKEAWYFISGYDKALAAAFNHKVLIRIAQQYSEQENA